MGPAHRVFEVDGRANGRPCHQEGSSVTVEAVKLARQRFPFNAEDGKYRWRGRPIVRDVHRERPA